MRDPNRIDECCKKLAKSWSKMPDFRLAQLLINILSMHGKSVFYLEDEEFLDFIDKWVNNIIDWRKKDG